MLGLGRYLLGVAEIAVLLAFAWLGASALRSRLVPSLSGAPAYLTTMILALALLIWPAELLGTLGLFDPLPYLLLVGAVGGGSWWFFRRVAEDEGGRGQPGPQGPRDSAVRTSGRAFDVATLVALAIA